MANSRKSQPAIPESEEELVALLAERLALENKRDKIENVYSTRVQLARQSADKELAAFLPRLKELNGAITAFMNRSKRRRFNLPVGSLGWRKFSRTEPVFRKQVHEIIDYCKANGMGRFVRTVEELNREAMQADKETAASIPGVSFPRSESLLFRAAGRKGTIKITSRRRT